jgi:hypothetical protein
MVKQTTEEQILAELKLHNELFKKLLKLLESIEYKL